YKNLGSQSIFGESTINSVEPKPTSAGKLFTKATFPFSGQGVILAKRMSPTLNLDSPDPSSFRQSTLRIPAKFSPTAAISMKGYSRSFRTGYRGLTFASMLIGDLDHSGMASGKQSVC